MFTWICPQCGREVLPSYTECPDCAAKAKTAPPPPAAEPPHPPAPAEPRYEPQAAPPAYGPPQPQYPPQQQAYMPPPPQYPPHPQYAAPPPHYAQRPSRGAGLPTWLLTLVFALAFVGLGAAIYWGIGYLKGGGSQAAAPPPTVESPAAKPGAKTSPLQKYVEISGVRFTEDPKKKLDVKFILTNHSDADLTGLTGNVTIWGRTQKSEEDAVGTFSFNTNVGPGASQEVTAPLTTKLKIYELPDWQNVTTDLQITGPQ